MVPGPKSILGECIALLCFTRPFFIYLGVALRMLILRHPMQNWLLLPSLSVIWKVVGY